MRQERYFSRDAHSLASWETALSTQCKQHREIYLFWRNISLNVILSASKETSLSMPRVFYIKRGCFDPVFSTPLLTIIFGIEKDSFICIQKILYPSKVKQTKITNIKANYFMIQKTTPKNSHLITQHLKHRPLEYFY